MAEPTKQPSQPATPAPKAAPAAKAAPTAKPKKDATKEMKKKNNADYSDSTIRYLPIGEIHDDTVIMKDGSLRAIIEVTSINFSLKSEDEQNSIIMSYQGFLNSLEHPIQIYIRSKKLDLEDYIADLRNIAQNQENLLLKNQTQEYISFISKLIEYADIMEKRFYVVVPYDAAGVGVRKSMIQLFMDAINPDDSLLRYKSRLKAFKEQKKKLTQRATVIQGGLENCGLQTKVLNSKELIELYYSIYNPLTSLAQKLREPNTGDTKVKG